MRLLITGATGLLGNNLLRLALERGHQVRALVRPSYDRRTLAGLDVETAPGDVCRPDSLAAALPGCDAVLHAAGWVRIGWQQGEQYEAVNVEGTRNVAVACRQAGLPLVSVSTVNALGLGRWDRPADEEWSEAGIVPCPYVVSKRQAEAAVLEQVRLGLRGMLVLPGFMLGPWDWKPSSGQMLLQVAHRRPPLAPSGGCSLCDARDVAAGTLAALEQGRPGRRYVLAGHNLSYLAMWRLFARVAGTRPPLAKAGPLIQLAAGKFGDWCSRFTRREGELNSAAAGMGRQVHFFSSRRAEEELGYASRPAEETVRDAWQWLRQVPTRQAEASAPPT